MGLEFTKAVLSTSVVAVATFGFGICLLPFLPHSLSTYSRYVCAWVAGFGLFGVAIFVIGFWSFTPTAIGIVIAAGVLNAGVHFWKAKDQIALLLLGWQRPPAFPVLVIALVLGITAVGGLAEPVGDWSSDGVAYHLTGAKTWLRQGVIRPIPDNAPTSYPCNGEMIFAGVMAFGGQRAPGFSAVFSLALFLMLVASIARRCGLGATGAWWAMAVVSTMGAVYEGAHSGFVDVIYAMFVLAAARTGLDAGKLKQFAGFGVFCGLAIATKYPGLLAFPALLFCAAWPRKGFPKGENWQSAAVAGIVAGVVGCAFYLKNWIFLGSPIYPPPAIAAKFLHVKYYTPETLRNFYGYAIHRGQGHGRGILKFFLLPFELTYHTADFNGGGGIGLAPLALGPPGVIGHWRSHFARRLAVLGGLLVIEWFVTMQEARYLDHVFAIGAIFAVLGWRFCGELLGRRGRILGGAILAGSIAYGLVMIVPSRFSDIHAVFSSTYSEQRRKANIPFLQSIDYLNHDPGATKILILNPAVMTYYLDKDEVKAFGQWWEQVFPDAPKGKDVLSKIATLKVSHVLDVKWTDSGFQVPADYPGLSLVFETPNQKIYKVSGLGTP